MAAVRYRAHIATTTGADWPDPSLSGLSGQVVAAGTTNPLTITEDEAGLIPIPESRLTITGQVMVPGFWCQDGTTEADWLSGEYRVPLDSMTGLKAAADAAAAEAASTVALNETVRTDAETARDAAQTARDEAEAAAAVATAPTAEAVEYEITTPGRPAHDGLLSTFATKDDLADVQPSGNYVASHGSVGRLVALAESDPLPPLEPGDLVVGAATAAATTFFTDFSEYPTGESPADWMHPWLVGAYRVDADPTATGGKVLRHTSTDQQGNKAFVWTAIPDVADVEVLMRWRTTNSVSPTVAARASGAQGTEMGYRAGVIFQDSAEGFGVLNNGAYSNITGLVKQPNPAYVTEQWYLTRVRLEGDLLSYRSWKDGDPEPTAWRVSAADTTVPTPGGTGLFFSNVGGINGQFVDWYSAAINGQTAMGPA